MPSDALCASNAFRLMCGGASIANQTHAHGITYRSGAFRHTASARALAKLAERSMQLQANGARGRPDLEQFKDSVHLEVLRWK